MTHHAKPAQERWPATLWIVRHGESAGNVARDLAEAGQLARIDIAERDVDVPLSARGEEQALAGHSKTTCQRVRKRRRSPFCR